MEKHICEQRSTVGIFKITSTKIPKIKVLSGQAVETKEKAWLKKHDTS